MRRCGSHRCVRKEQALQVLARVDDVVGSECCRPSYLDDYLITHGEFKTSMGSRDFLSPPVVVWKLLVRPIPLISRDEGAGNAK